MSDVFVRTLTQVRNSKLIDDDGPPELSPLWTEARLIEMHDAFCAAMLKAIKDKRELPRQNKLVASGV